MPVVITEEPFSRLPEHAQLPISFRVESILDVRPDGNSDQWRLEERAVTQPFLKDYDAIPGNHPLDWPRRFDMSSWGLLAARSDGRLVGGAIVAFRSGLLELLQGRSDIALLWDLRVLPQLRRTGVGSALFRAAERWAGDRRCRQVRVETQQINVAACRFYAAQGCHLDSVRPDAYPALPGEIQLVWRKDLPAP